MRTTVNVWGQKRTQMTSWNLVMQERSHWDATRPSKRRIPVWIVMNSSHWWVIVRRDIQRQMMTLHLGCDRQCRAIPSIQIVSTVSCSAALCNPILSVCSEVCKFRLLVQSVVQLHCVTPSFLFVVKCMVQIVCTVNSTVQFHCIVKPNQQHCTVPSTH